MAEYIGAATSSRATRGKITARTRAWERWGGPAPFPGQERGRAKDWEKEQRRALQVGDLAVAGFGSAVAYVVRFGVELSFDLILALLVPAVWLVALHVNGAYQLNRFGAGSEEYRAIGRAAAATFGAVAIVSYLLNANLARGFVIPVAATVLLGSMAVHWSLRRRLYRQRMAGHSLRDTIVIGRADSCASMIREMRAAPPSGYRVVGACVVGRTPADGHIDGVPVLGAPEAAVGAVDRLDVEVVAVASHPDIAGQTLRRLGWALAERQVDLVVSPGIVEVAGPRLSLRPAAGLSLLHVERPADSIVRLVTKRLMDSILAMLICLVFLPVGLLVALLIKIDSRGPVFFQQERVGTHGRRFKMVKFRSVYPDAEQRKESIDGGNEVNKVLFKVKGDPRVTRVGKIIRRYSIDEVPQLINVLKGDMSLVGPRPSLPVEVAQYEDDAMQRLRVRPGMTGLWQISGRSDLNWEQSLRLDLWYVDNWTPLLDLQILARTGRAVLGAAGAY